MNGSNSRNNHKKYKTLYSNNELLITDVHFLF